MICLIAIIFYRDILALEMFGIIFSISTFNFYQLFLSYHNQIKYVVWYLILVLNNLIAGELYNWIE